MRGNGCIAAPPASQICPTYEPIVNPTVATNGKLGKIMTRMRQPADTRGQNGTKTRQSTAAGRNEGEKAVLSRLPSALLRAILVVLLIVTPSVVLPMNSAESSLTVTLIALFAALFTFVEYMASSPSVVEFRSAPPFNRVRFVALFVTVFLLSLLYVDPNNAGTFTRFFHLVGERVGQSIDFPYSPVRLFLLMMPSDTSIETLSGMRTAAGLSYLISLISLAVFVVMLRMRRWPKRNGTFNVWVNLPRFDPTAGGDVVARLNRDSTVNLILGFLLPFVIPAIMKIVFLFGGNFSLDDPQTLIWAVTAWAFLPASLLMRGVALSRVAQLIYVQRKKAYAQALADGALPA